MIETHQDRLKYIKQNYRKDFVLSGFYYGYPSCCIREFSRDFSFHTKKQYPSAPWYGTGFIPCLKCAKDAMSFKRFMKERIVPHRITEVRFPKDEVGQKTIEDIFKEILTYMYSVKRTRMYVGKKRRKPILRKIGK